MARLIPARPRHDTPSDEAALLALEAGLDDDHVIFQKRPVASGYLVAHPENGLCLVLARETATWDPDAEVWAGADLDTEAKAAREAVSAHGLDARIAAVALIAGIGAPMSGHPGIGPRVAFADEVPSLPNRVAAALATGAPIGEAAISALIQSLSPGAAPYAKGTVTDAQLAWREQNGRVAAPVQMTDPILPSESTPLTSAAVVASSVPAQREPDITNDDPVILMMRQAIDTVVGERRLFAVGVSIDPGDLVDPTSLLPALLICAADDWAPVVASKAGRGGFHVRLRSDPDGLTGYRVSAIHPSTPLLLLLPVMDRVRRSLRNGEFVLDDTISQFGRWLADNRFDGAAMQDIDIRVALNIA